MTGEQDEASEAILWEDIKSRCDAATIEYEESARTRPVPGSDEVERRMLRAIRLPAGPTTRRIYIWPHELKSLCSIKFERYCFLGDYHAIWNKDDGSIEAKLVVNTRRHSFNRIIRRFANFEDLDPPRDATSPIRSRYSLPKVWRIRADKNSLSIELSPPSTEFLRLGSDEPLLGEITLKISGTSEKEYNLALRILCDIGSALSFELDVRNDIQVALARPRRYEVPSRRKVISDLPMRFPEATYPEEPLELFQYGRAASSLPLLQFLAYYQVVEYFFPIYSRQAVASRLRIALKQPRFDVNDDIALSRVLSAILPEGKNFINEREQLRHTLHACLEPQTIRDLIEASEEYLRHFTAKNQSIKGVERMILHDRQPDLRDQAADRIYAIRCRVVHAKQDGRDAAVDLLLPSSPETSYMLPEIDLMCTVAQQVLAVAGQTPRLW